MDGPSAEADDSTISLLSHLKTTQPEKYKKLRERFIGPAFSLDTLAKQASFTGQEVFFKLFIDVAKDAAFTQHLKDILTLKLLELNGQEFDLTPDLDCETSTAVDSFADCILTVRLIAKFLGYIHFFPYICDKKVTPAIEEQYTKLRMIAGPQLDVSRMLEEANDHGRMCVCVPWLVQYMSQIDTFSVSLPYYRGVLCKLSVHYETLRARLSTASSGSTLLLQYVSIAWLFSLTKFDNLELSTVEIAEAWKPRVSSEHTVDTSSLANMKLVYDCCIALQGVKHRLVQYVIGLRARINVTRKITPLTANDSSRNALTACGSSETCVAGISALRSAQSSIQEQLEDNFFHNQPASLKKSIGFIAERVSSSYIKEFRGGTLNPKMIDGKLFARAEADKVLKTEQSKEAASAAVAKFSTALVSDLHNQAKLGINEYIEKRGKQALKLLLPSETEDFVLDVSSVVMIRQGRERLIKWLSSYLTVDYVTTELSHEVHKFIRNNGRVSDLHQATGEAYIVMADSHNDNSLSGSEALFTMQSLNSRALIGEDVQYEEMYDIVSSCLLTLTSRNDLVDIVMSTLIMLLISTLVALTYKCPEKVSTDFVRLFSPLWNDTTLLKYSNNHLLMIPMVTNDEEGDGNDPDDLGFYSRLMDFLFSCGALSQ